MKTKHKKGTHVHISKNGKITNVSTNLSHDIEVEKNDIFVINWGRGDINYRVIDNRYPLVAEEIEEL
jgi:hypothetical protein